MNCEEPNSRSGVLKLQSVVEPLGELVKTQIPGIQPPGFWILCIFGEAQEFTFPTSPEGMSTVWL